MLINNPLKKKDNERKPKLTSHSNLPYILLRLEKLIKNWEEAKTTDTYLFLSNPRKAIWANIMIGISRGVGFVMGVSIFGVIVITAIGWLFSYFVTIPVIGEFVATIVKSVQEYLRNNTP